MFIGIDQSFNCTAITVMFSPTNYNISTIKGKGDTAQKKLKYIHQRVRKIIHESYSIYTEKMKQSPKTIYCCIEGGSYTSTGRLFSLGQLSGVILSCLMVLGVEYKEITPSQLKKFITGHGLADKKFVMRKIKEKYGIYFRSDDKADSYVLALIAYNLKNDGRILKEFREEAEVLNKLINPEKKKKKIRYRRSISEF